MKVALATCARLPEPDPDEAPLLDALRAAGHAAEPLAWDAGETDPGGFDAVVIRATWNYPQDPERFLRWLEAVDRATVLLNPLPLARWNLEKTYLRSLEARGVPIVPTLWPEPGESGRSLARERGWGEVVAKPVIGAGSLLTRRFAASDPELDAFLERAAPRPMMVQPYLRSVETRGERSVVAIEGALTHAVLKSPRFDGDDERIEPVPLDDRLRGFALHVLEAIPEPPLYARVDVLEDDDGALRLGELELLEPSLFFDLGGPDGLDKMVTGIARRVAGIARRAAGADR